MKRLHEKVLDALASRKVWEGRQNLFYQMRHDGLGRRNKPFPGAADLHFPLVDTVIEKLKPFYFQQAFSSERVAEFVARRNQLEGVTDAAADYLHYEMTERAEFEMSLLSVIDMMCLRGRGVLKVVFDLEERRLLFEPKDPLFIVMPPGANDFEDADWFCEIKQLTVAKYRRNGAYKQEAEFLRRICGRGLAEDGTDEAKDVKYSREGLTHSDDKDTVILYEYYERSEDGGWVVREWSPLAPEEPVRPEFRYPVKFQGRWLQPFVSFAMEVKDPGWYSPRGVAERLGSFESSLNKLWNEKHDAMSFYNRPLFSGPRTAVNAHNIRFRPGELLPEGVQAVSMPSPPFSFDQEMVSTRQTAEQSLMMPDFGVAEGGAANKTATEVDYIRSLSSTGVDLKGRIFRKSLARVYLVSWALLLMYRPEELSYFVGKDLRVLPEEALHDAYLIRPSGSPDAWNKQQKMQRAAVRFQLFRGAPNVDQDELVKDVLRADDGRLVERLFVASGQRERGEAEEEAKEVLLLLAGWPVQAEANEDHLVRIQTLIGFAQLQDELGRPLDPLALQRLQEHLAQHRELLKAVDPGADRKVEAMLQELAGQQGPQVQQVQQGVQGQIGMGAVGAV